MDDRTKKLEQVVVKLAHLVKAQDKQIKKLAQKLMGQELFNAIMREANSFLMVSLSDDFGGKVDVKLDDSDAFISVTVKKPLDDAKQKAIKDGLAAKLAPLGATLAGLTFVSL